LIWSGVILKFLVPIYHLSKEKPIYCILADSIETGTAKGLRDRALLLFGDVGMQEHGKSLFSDRV
jgi:hypothetical protein